MPLQASVRDMDEQEEELESSWIFFFFALLPLALLFALMFSPYLNQAHLPKQWAWHICLLYMLCDDWAAEGHGNLYLIRRLGSEMDGQRAHLL